jgi:formylglycine-generating enzyme required for sulfatase activity
MQFEVEHECGQRFMAEDWVCGKLRTCPKCGRQFVVPSPWRDESSDGPFATPETAMHGEEQGRPSVWRRLLRSLLVPATGPVSALLVSLIGELPSLLSVLVSMAIAWLLGIMDACRWFIAGVFWLRGLSRINRASIWGRSLAMTQLRDQRPLEWLAARALEPWGAAAIYATAGMQLVDGGSWWYAPGAYAACIVWFVLLAVFVDLGQWVWTATRAPRAVSGPLMTRWRWATAVLVLCTIGLVIWLAAGGSPSRIADRPNGNDSPPAQSQGALSIGPSAVLDLGSGVSMKLVRIEPGTFTMGSPTSELGRLDDENQHQVTISKPFQMGTTEVTQDQYEAVVGNNPSRFKGARNPVERVSWDDAAGFCKKLSAKTGKTIRLPTEAEWEYACRAGGKAKFSFGDADGDLGAYAWYGSLISGETHPVGQKKPNAWGLHDMHGNVREWCADWYGDYPTNAVNDPRGPARGSARVVRGGSCNDFVPDSCRSARRLRSAPDYRSDSGGFRVVLQAP